jgi:hypothetical protein
MSNAPWHAGQRAIIDRRTIVTIDRVTPKGWAVVGERRFGADGRKIGGLRTLLEPLTPEIEAEIALATRGNEASRDALGQIEAANSWLRQRFSWNRRVTDAGDVEKAEHLAAAIRQVMGRAI